MNWLKWTTQSRFLWTPLITVSALSLPGIVRAESLEDPVVLNDSAPEKVVGPGFQTSWGLAERNFFDVQSGMDAPGRQALTSSLFINLKADAAVGGSALGLRASPVFSAALERRGDVGNFTLTNRNGTTAARSTWSGISTWSFQGTGGPVSIDVGLKEIDNPFFDSRANRSLPPAFHGVTGDWQVKSDMVVSAGIIDSVRPRGSLDRIHLTTTYGQTAIPSVTYVGVSGFAFDGWSTDLFVSRARTLWTQWFGAARREVKDGWLGGTSWSAAAYLTNSLAVPAQGHGHNLAWSLAASRQTALRPLSIGVSYQQINGDQFFDYVDETWGIRLANALSVDYNAPHEKSIQLNCTLASRTSDGTQLRLTTWKAFGWDASGGPAALSFAGPGAGVAHLYIVNGQPIHGAHQDAGLNLAVTFASAGSGMGPTTLRLVGLAHHAPLSYGQGSFRELRVMLDWTFH